MIDTLIAVLNMSMGASIVAIAVILVRFPLKKAPKIFSYMLWAIVFWRLVCPISFESPVSLMPTNATMISSDIITAETPQIHSGISVIDTPVNLFVEHTLPQVNPAESANPVQIILFIGACVWLGGLILMVLYAVIGYIRVKRNIYDATLMHDNIFETDKIPTAFVLGVIRPKIYVPTTVKDQQLQFILKHEQVHIRRRDYLIKPLAFLVLAVHWFNPIVWLSYYLMSKDMEMSCDEAVLRSDGTDIRQDYSLALVNLYTRKPRVLSPLAFGEGSIRNRKSRIKNVLNFKKTSRWVIVFCSFLLVLFTAGFTTNPPQELMVEKFVSTEQDVSELNIALESYYVGQSSRAFKMIQKSIFTKMLVNGWLDEIGDIENPVWNYDTFTCYQILDYELSSATHDEELYYCTFSADNHRQGYVVVAYDGSGLRRISAVETPYLYDLQVNLDDVALQLENADIDLSTASAVRTKMVDTKNNRSDDVILFTDNQGNHYLYYFDNVSFVTKQSVGERPLKVSKKSSLVENFEKYKSFGVVYNDIQDAVYYNGERVKLFVEFKSYKEENMTYAFELCYQDNKADSSLYLEAIKDSNGNVTGVRRLDEEIARDLIENMNVSKPERGNSETFFVTMDAVQVLEEYGIIAQDATKDKVDGSIQDWMKECDEKQGAYILKKQTSNGYMIYIYYNGGGRYPWNMKVENHGININLYDDIRLTTGEGYYLMYFSTPEDYSEIKLYLDGTEIQFFN